MKIFDGALRMKGLKRFGVITRVLIRHGLGDIADRLFGRSKVDLKAPTAREVSFKSGYPSPKRLRRVLEELGPSFIKLGQLLSTRADIFPPAYLEEFRKLQDRVPPVAFPDIKKVIEAELKRPLADIFSKFTAESTAAASVAQVHTGRLSTGDKVAVKVIRPGIEKKIREDIRLMYYFAQKIEKTFEISQMLGTINLVKEFERTIFKELDMFIEAGSMEKFATNFENVDELYIAKVYWEYTSKSVLVMEHIDGIKMDQVQTIVDNGIDPKEVAMIGLRSFSRQLMEFGFFHGDPHPGNAIVMFDGDKKVIRKAP